MARQRNFDVSGINIRVHSRHAPDEYVELWKKFHAKKVHVSHASNALMIGDIRFEDKSNSKAPIYGSFYRFLDVDVDNPWFNIVKHKRATDDDIELVNIPPEMKPDLVEIPYVFDVVKHHLYFVSHEAAADLSPRLVHKLLTRLSAEEEILERFGKVDLTVITDKGKVEQLLRWPVIRSLTITIDRPNPTEEEDDAAFYESLRRKRASSETRIYKKADDELSLEPDNEIRALARIAADNGVVEVAGKNMQRVSDKASSKSFPLRIKSSYDSNLQSLMNALKDVVFNRTGRIR